VKERPILFSGSMVRAILEGRKIQTRRVVKLPNRVLSRTGPHKLLFYNTGSHQYPGWHKGYSGDQPPGLAVRCHGDGTTQKVPSPYGIPGDGLWVKEPFLIEEVGLGAHNYRYRADDTTRGAGAGDWLQIKGQVFDAHNPPDEYRWRPSIFMYRFASRIQLEVLSIRVERVQDITEEDAQAEGTDLGPWGSWRIAFAELWDSINAKRGFSWESNPWCWVVDFKRIEKG